MTGFLARVFGRDVETKSDSIAEFLYSGMGFKPTNSGVTVSEKDESILFSTTACACATALSCGIAMLPGSVKRTRGDGGSDIVRDHPAWDLLLDQPNEWQTPIEWVETMMLHAVLCGDGISYINKVRGQPRELIPLLPSQVSIRQNPDYSLVYQITLVGGEYLELGRKDVFHLKAPSFNNYSGIKASRYAREAIGLALATEETHARLHSNATRPSGALTTDGKLDQPAVDALRAQFAQNYTGNHNSSKPLILANGLKWAPMAMSGVDAQHIATRQFQIEEICRAFGVFPAIIGHSDKTATFASAEAFFQAHVNLSLGRWISKFEQSVMFSLMTKQERREGLHYDLDARSLLRGDHKARAEFYNTMITLGAMTRNEARIDEGWNPLPGLDDPITPLNMGTQQQDTTQNKSAVEIKSGRVLSGVNEGRIVSARDNLNTVLDQLPSGIV